MSFLLIGGKQANMLTIKQSNLISEQARKSSQQAAGKHWGRVRLNMFLPTLPYLSYSQQDLDKNVSLPWGISLKLQ